MSRENFRELKREGNDDDEKVSTNSNKGDTMCYRFLYDSMRP